MRLVTTPGRKNCPFLGIAWVGFNRRKLYPLVGKSIGKLINPPLKNIRDNFKEVFPGDGFLGWIFVANFVFSKAAFWPQNASLLSPHHITHTRVFVRLAWGYKWCVTSFYKQKWPEQTWKWFSKCLWIDDLYFWRLCSKSLTKPDLIPDQSLWNRIF